MKICDLYVDFIRTQHPTTAAVMLVYDVTAKASVALMKYIYDSMINHFGKHFLTTDIPKVIVANKMDLYDPEQHEVNLQCGLAFAEEKTIAHFYTSTLDPRSVYGAFKYLASEYAKLHIPKGQLTMEHVVMHGCCHSGKSMLVECFQNGQPIQYKGRRYKRTQGIIL